MEKKELRTLQTLLAHDPDHLEAEIQCGVPEWFMVKEEPPELVRKKMAGKPMPLTANCRRNHTAVHSSGRRSSASIGAIVLHCTQCSLAETAARWFENPASGGSAQLCIDGPSCYRTLSNLVIPWAAPGANTWGVHLEIAGFAEWSRKEWLHHRGAIERSAFKGAQVATQYEVPIRLLTIAQTRLKREGFTTHQRCTKAFGGTHWDPGDGFPLDIYMAETRSFANDL